MTLRVRAEVLLHVRSFMIRRYPLNNSDAE